MGLSKLGFYPIASGRRYSSTLRSGPLGHHSPGVSQQTFVWYRDRCILPISEATVSLRFRLPGLHSSLPRRSSNSKGIGGKTRSFVSKPCFVLRAWSPLLSNLATAYRILVFVQLFGFGESERLREGESGRQRFREGGKEKGRGEK